MKVIGKTNDGLLLSASESELANLFGFYWSGDKEWQAVLDELGFKHRGGSRDLTGLEIKPDIAYNRLSWLKKREREFDDLCKTLRDTADKIQDSRPLFDRIAADKDVA